MSMNEPPPEIKVGDDLAVDRNAGQGVFIIKVEKVTPSGRIVAGPYTLNPDLTIRGADKWGPYRARLATNKDFDDYVRRNIACKIERMVQKNAFRDMPLEKLKAIDEIITKETTPAEFCGSTKGSTE
jgi:hypothetical protein